MIIPDVERTLQKRHAAQSAHIKAVKPLIDSGQLSFFGVTLSGHPHLGRTPNINGSVMVISAESEDGVLCFLNDDAYTKAGVWDVQKAKIYPFRSG